MKHEWNSEEDSKLQKLHDQFGNKWSLIAKYFSNRFIYLDLDLITISKTISFLNWGWQWDIWTSWWHKITKNTSHLKRPLSINWFQIVNRNTMTKVNAVDNIWSSLFVDFLLSRNKKSVVRIFIINWRKSIVNSIIDFSSS